MKKILISVPVDLELALEGRAGDVESDGDFLLIVGASEITGLSWSANK